MEELSLPTAISWIKILTLITTLPLITPQTRLKTLRLEISIQPIWRSLHRSMGLWLASKSISSMSRATTSMRIMQGERDLPCTSSKWLRSDSLITPTIAMAQCTRWLSTATHRTGSSCQHVQSHTMMWSAVMSSSTCNRATRITMVFPRMEDCNGQWCKAQSISSFAKQITASIKSRLKSLRSTSTYSRWTWPVPSLTSCRARQRVNCS